MSFNDMGEIIGVVLVVVQPEFSIELTGEPNEQESFKNTSCM